MVATGYGQKGQNPDGSYEKFAWFRAECGYSSRILGVSD
jgi:hypothetical protein